MTKRHGVLHRKKCKMMFTRTRAGIGSKSKDGQRVTQRGRAAASPWEGVGSVLWEWPGVWVWGGLLH